MLNLALWLKKNNFKLDQVQTFTPTPMSMATAMYHSKRNPLHKVAEDSEVVETAKSGKTRKAHKAFLRYYDPANWPILRETLHKMGRGDLIGNGERHLIPAKGGGEEGGFEQHQALVSAQNERQRPAAGRGGAQGGRGSKVTVSVSAAPARRGAAGAAGAKPFVAPESTVRPSILSTIKTRPKASPAPAKGGRPAKGTGRK
jgi:hypothetical protein